MYRPTRPVSARQWAKAALLRTGHYVRKLRRTHFPGVAVLSYHGLREDHVPDSALPSPKLHVRRSEFVEHCRVVSELCHPLGLGEWDDARAGRSRLPARPVVITFDDGYRSVLDIAVPILRRFNLGAILFICSELAVSKRLIWADVMFGKHSEAEVESIKSLSWQAQREAILSHSADAPDGHPLALVNAEQIKMLPSLGIEVGGHTGMHMILARGSSEEQRAELSADKQRLEALVGRPLRAFAYPNGRPAIDFTDDTSRLVAELGYQVAFSTRNGFATANQSPFCLSRFMMLAEVSRAELLHRFTYSWL
jgi:peptidoglycan/xylan/chitin deacetylase (PgdA/CDA1 family)